MYSFIVELDDITGATWHLVDPETVGQMLVKYEGVEYYEHDIIKDWNGTRELLFNIFDTEQGCDLQLDDTDLEVIGNTIDNPELLKL